MCVSEKELSRMISSLKSTRTTIVKHGSRQSYPRKTAGRFHKAAGRKLHGVRYLVQSANR
ncbi:hypothetical protein JXJ21_09590 [candidate division KSB1 bacterium]|nr:hypothetical protein [candidate division KSB1 bacterium]